MNDVPTFSTSFKTKASIITVLYEKTLTSSKNHKSGQTKLEALYMCWCSWPWGSTLIINPQYLGKGYCSSSDGTRERLMFKRPSASPWDSHIPLQLHPPSPGALILSTLSFIFKLVILQHLIWGTSTQLSHLRVISSIMGIQVIIRH